MDDSSPATIGRSIEPASWAGRDFAARVADQHRVDADQASVGSADEPIVQALLPLSLALARIAARSPEAPWRIAMGERP